MIIASSRIALYVVYVNIDRQIKMFKNLFRADRYSQGSNPRKQYYGIFKTLTNFK